MTDIPIVMGPTGMLPTPPAVLRAQLVALVAATNPGYTDNLPGSLIEDVASTDVAAIALMNQFLIDLVNSITPLGANDFLLTKLGEVYGVEVTTVSNTSVYVVFSSDNAPGFVIPRGFTVSDGTYQYIVQDGGIIGADGDSLPCFCLATTTGSWAVVAGTVNQLATSVPAPVSLTCTNPQAGIPGQTELSPALFRSQVLTAGKAISTGMSTMLRTRLGNVPGVQARLVSIIQLPNNGGWEIIVGGGDPYQIGFAIFQSIGSGVALLVGSSINVTAFSKANPGIVTTDKNIDYVDGQQVTIAGSVVTAWNGAFTITVIDEKHFSVGVDTTGFATYTGGGVCTPNSRNQVPSINDFPDAYAIPFVVPPAQAVTMTVTWNTTLPNFTSTMAVAQLAGPALVDYINNIYAGQPINELVMDQAFAAAVADLIPAEFLTRLVYSISVNGIGVSPISGTREIVGDPESFFLTTLGAINIVQG